MSQGAPPAQYGNKGNNTSTNRTIPTPRRLSTSTRNPYQLTVTGNRDSLPSIQTTQLYFTSRENVQFSRQLQLETNNIGPLDSTGGTRLSHQVGQASLPPNDHFSIVKRRVLAGEGGSPEPASERSSGNGIYLPGPIHKQAVPCSKERRIVQTHGESETSELLCPEIPFQNGRVRNDQGSIANRRLDVYLGHIPVGSSCPGTQEFSEVHVGQKNLRVHLSSIWTSQCSPHICKVSPASHGILAEAGTTIDHYLDDILIMHQSREGLLHQVELTMQLLESLGFTINREKSQLSLSQQIQFLGFQVDSRQMKFFLLEEKVQDTVQICQEILIRDRLPIWQLSQLLGKLNVAPQALLSAPLHYRQLQQLKIQSLRRSKSFNTLVTLDQRATEELLRCRMGSSVPGSQDRRTMVPSGARPAHQYVRTDSSPVSSTDICKGWPQRTETHPSNNGQCLNTDICLPDGGN